MIKLKTLAVLLLINLSYNSFSQSRIVHEIGVIAEGIEFRSDYGQRGDIRSNLSNTGFGIAIVDYLNFSVDNNSNSFFSEHLKVRSEFSFSKTNLRHYGDWTKGTSLGANQLLAMRGSTQLISLGTQLEYYPLSIHDYENSVGSFAPYIALGVQVSYYTNTATSTLGELGNPITTYPKYLSPSEGRPYGFSNESNAVASQVFNVGTRYKLNRMSDLVFDMRFQFFYSDWVDGLNPNKNLYPENKSNDWLNSIGVGYIVYLDY
jgi:hypothetical protein